MKKYKVILKSPFYSCDCNKEFEFEVYDNATMYEIEKRAYQVLLGNLDWCVKK